MCLAWNHFVILMWKHMTLFSRRPVSTILQLTIPLLFFLILLALFLSEAVPMAPREYWNFEGSGPKPNTEPSTEPYDLNRYQYWSDSDLGYYDRRPFPAIHVDPQMQYDGTFLVGYGPKSPAIDNLMTGFKENSPMVKLDVKGFDNLTEMDNEVFAQKLKAAIVFSDKFDEIPDSLDVTIRLLERDFNTDKLFEEYFVNNPVYADKFFLLLQRQILYGLFYNRTLKASYDPKDVAWTLLNVKWHHDSYSTVVSMVIPTLIWIYYFYPFLEILQDMTAEKEGGLKDLFEIRGVRRWIIWLGWFIRIFVIFFLIATLIFVFTGVKIASPRPAIVYNKDMGAYAQLIYYFALSKICYLLMVSALVSNAYVATMFGLLLAGLELGLVYAVIYISSKSLAVFLALINPTAAMSLGFQIVGFFQYDRNKDMLDGVVTELHPIYKLSTQDVLIILMTEALLYLILALIFEEVNFHRIVVRLKKIFRRSRVSDSTKDPSGSTHDVERPRSSHHVTKKNFEAEPKNLKVAIAIKNLTKRFGNKTVVNNLTFNIYEGQITVLLGHNGAGKTTTISMLTGLLPPTDGTAIINGVDLVKNPRKVRSDIGICPQHDVIVNKLTVREHLYLFARLKGLDDHEADKESEKYLKVLRMSDKREMLASRLSGGFKRRLNVCIAMCGDTKIVFLDEPTAGMDPSIRRNIWDFLIVEKKHRAILLTTHLMDEADILADRTAIMNEGVLACVGTNYFLKKRFGSGYHLILDKTDECVPENVTRLIKKHIADAEMSSMVGSELVYTLPESQVGRFQPMLQELESKMAAIGITGYGISVTTMEEVFLKATAEHFSVVEDAPTGKLEVDQSQKRSGLIFFDECLTSLVCYLKLLVSKWYAILFMLLILLAFTLLAWSLLKMKSVQEQPPLKITLETYENLVVLVSPRKVTSELQAMYEHVASKNLKKVDDIAGYVSKAKKMRNYYSSHSFLVGCNFSASENDTVYYNPWAYHSAPLTYSLMLNAIYKVNVDPKKEIVFTNHPYSKLYYEKFEDGDDAEEGNPLDRQQMGMFSHLQDQSRELRKRLLRDQFTAETKIYSNTIMLYFLFAFVICLSQLAFLQVSERINNFKYQLVVSGLSPYLHLAIKFILDYILMLLCLGFMVGLLEALKVREMKEKIDYEIYVVPALGFFFGGIPYVYLWSYLFEKPYVAAISIMSLNILFVVIPLIATLTDWGLGLDASTSKSLDDFFSLIPPFLFCSTLKHNLLWKAKSKALCSGAYGTFCSAGQSVINSYIRELFLLFFLYSAILLLIESKYYRVVTTAFGRALFSGSKKKADDSDVQKEKERVMTTNVKELRKTHEVILKQVSKVYCCTRVVKNISVAVKPNECFGLLGVNGAGKTTTFEMMTGNISITSGTIYLRGLNLSYRLNATHKFIGYCPQFDSLMSNMKVKTNLRLFCMLRRIPRKMIKDVIKDLAQAFGFTRYLNMNMSELSGGNKRKVSVAVACLGSPEIIFLDEPTTGLDPVNKRHIWNIIASLRDSGKSIILTSHSMEECEALCTRLSIMVNGELKCMGSVQHLKNKFAEGCNISMRVSGEDGEASVEKVTGYLKSQFETVTVKDFNQDFVSYKVLSKDLLWSNVFKIMEDGKRKLPIEDYSIGQSNLEDVFLAFTRHQKRKKGKKEEEEVV